MASRADVRKIAMALTGAIEGRGDFGFSVKDAKGKERAFLWSWKERIDPKKARVPSPTVIAVRVNGDDAKQALLSIDPAKIFTEPHYNGFPAVLVRLPAVSAAELRKLVTDAHRCMVTSTSRPKTRAASGKARPARRRRSRS